MIRLILGFGLLMLVGAAAPVEPSVIAACAAAVGCVTGVTP